VVSKKLPSPEPQINLRLLAVSALLLAFCLGLVVAVAAPGYVILLLVVLGLASLGLAAEAYFSWEKAHRAWLSRPIRKLPKSKGVL